jgi:hypothetical protein
MMKLSSEHQRGESDTGGIECWSTALFSLPSSSLYQTTAHVAEEAPTPFDSPTSPWSEHSIHHLITLADVSLRMLRPWLGERGRSHACGVLQYLSIQHPHHQYWHTYMHCSCTAIPHHIHPALFTHPTLACMKKRVSSQSGGKRLRKPRPGWQHVLSIWRLLSDTFTCDSKTIQKTNGTW